MGVSGGKGFGIGAEAGIGASFEFTNEDHVDKLRGYGRLDGVNTPWVSLGATNTDPFFVSPYEGGWIAFGPTFGGSVYSIQTASVGQTIEIGF